MELRLQPSRFEIARLLPFAILGLSEYPPWGGIFQCELQTGGLVVGPEGLEPPRPGLKVQTLISRLVLLPTAEARFCKGFWLELSFLVPHFPLRCRPARLLSVCCGGSLETSRHRSAASCEGQTHSIVLCSGLQVRNVRTSPMSRRRIPALL